MIALPAALAALAFGGVALYALIKGYMPIRPNLQLKRATHPTGYWLMVALHGLLAVFSASGVYLYLR